MRILRNKIYCATLCSALFFNVLFTLALQAASLQDLTTSESAVLIVSTETGKILGSANGDLLDKNYPSGSLAKVFTTIAYYQNHRKNFPVLQCPATLPSDPNGCWDRKGHGQVGIVEAIGHSCNVYFTQLSKRTSPEFFRKTLKQFDLPDAKGVEDIQAVMVGKSLDWTVSPLLLLRAYSAFFNGGYLYPHGNLNAKHVLLDDPLKKIIEQGMKLSSEQGTSTEARKATGQPLLGKTGTSLLWTDGKVNWRETQGWWIGFHPAEKPKIAVLTLVRKGRGSADAAPLGGKAISWYLQNQ